MPGSTIAASVTPAAASISSTSAVTAAAIAAASVASTAAITAATSAIAAAAASRSILARPGLIDVQIPSIEFTVVERLNGFIASARHFHEPEAATASGLPVRCHAGAGHFSKL